MGYNFSMSKRTHQKPPVKSRRAMPLVNDKGELVCPFCRPTHPLDPTEQSLCGTHIEITAVQTVYKAQYLKEPPKCLKCGGDKGEMVRFQGAFIHAVDCKPGMALMTETPTLTPWARWIYHLPDFAKRPIEKRIGRASPLELIDQEGKKTGEVAGYFFYKTGGQHAT